MEKKKYINTKLISKFILLLLFFILIRIGTLIPIWGINKEVSKNFFNREGFGFLNLITGDSFKEMSIFALSISPYITASIIIQLLTVTVPFLEKLSENGKTGKDKLEKITIGTSIIFALIQASGLAIGFGKQGLLIKYTPLMIMYVISIWTIGFSILILIANKFTKLNIGNGVSYILLINILSGFYKDLENIKEIFLKDKTIMMVILLILIFFIIFGILVMSCLFLSTTEVRIPIMFTKKVEGESNKNYLPIPLNTCNVMPIIFASSLISLPFMLEIFIKNKYLNIVNTYLNQKNWFNFHNIKLSIGLIIYVYLIYLFTDYYIDINFNYYQILRNLKLQNAWIIGQKAGIYVESFLKDIIKKTAFLGSSLSIIIILVFLFIANNSGLENISLGGTSILIVISVLVEARRTIKAEIYNCSNISYINNKSKK